MTDPRRLTDVARLDNVGGVASYILAAFAATLASLAVDVPQVVYREPGLATAWDGEQLTMSLAGITAGMVGQPPVAAPAASQMMQYADFDILLLRIVPALEDGGPGGLLIPCADDLDAAAATTIGDAQALYMAGLILRVQYAQTDPTTPFGLGPLTSLGPEGGIAGSMLRLSVQLL